MPTRLQSLLVSSLFLLSMGSSALAQDAQTNTADTAPPSTVGNPQLRNFELPGTRTTAPTTPPDIAAPPAPPPPVSETAPAPTATSTGSTPRPATTARSRTAPASPRATRETSTAAPTAAASAPALAPAQDLPRAQPAPPPVAAEPQANPEPVPAPADQQGRLPWLYIALGAVAALLGVIVFRKLRRPRIEEEAVLSPAASAASAAAAEPAPDPLFARSTRPEPAAPSAKLSRAPAAEPAPTSSVPAAATPSSDRVGIQMRPWIELQFKPARAAATLTEANVQFELVLVNSGNAPARNVQVGVRMFNAGPGQEREIESFYSEPFPQEAPAAVPELAPSTAVSFTSAVALPKEQVREVELQGRRLFIPTVAFNVIYEWGDGRSGQTSMSYLVGREAETPAAKMGGFRLDLGPRLYRSVGQRPIRVARTV